MSELIYCINNLSAKDIIKSVAKTANGTPFYLQTSGLGGFVAEYQAVYDVFSVKPTAAIAAAQNTMVAGLVDGGYWAGLDWFYDAGSYAEADVLINWVNPGTYTLTKNGVITWVQNTGVTSNGTTGYYATGWNPSVGGFNYIQNDAMVGIYVRNNAQDDGYIFGINAAHDIFFRPRTSADAITAKINDTSSLGGASVDSRGLWAVTRNGTAKIVYRNGASFSPAVIASTGMPDGDFAILSLNGGASFCTNQVSIIYAGKVSTMNQPAIYTLIQAYMTAKGVQV